MLISDEYKRMNAEMHKTIPSYGANGHRHAGIVRQQAQDVGAREVLDYGCGKGTLAETLPDLVVVEYDPAIPGKDSAPPPAQVVYCGDVAEHVEPEFLDEFLDDLLRVTERRIILVVATRAAVKTLPDGRNAHLIQKPVEWWLPKIKSRFRMKSCKASGGEFMFIGSPLQPHHEARGCCC